MNHDLTLAQALPVGVVGPLADSFAVSWPGPVQRK
jgi:hypothetical protein